jgi:TrmH family RNA methyltransferase
MTHTEIKRIQSLSQKKYRDAHRAFVVEGEKMVAELVQSSFVVQTVIACRPLSFPVPAGRRVEQVAPSLMERLSAFKTPPPVLAVVELPDEPPLPLPPATELWLALDNVQDPGNAGTLIRLADWFGIRRIVCSADTVDCYSPKVVQATMGALFRVPVHYTRRLPAFLQEAQRSTVVYGTFLDGADLYRQPLTPGGVIVMGNEGRGISSEVAATVSLRLRVPSYPESGARSESLNVAVSAAIVCGEFRRRSALTQCE